jgi:hypothetical protein
MPDPSKGGPQVLSTIHYPTDSITSPLSLSSFPMATPSGAVAFPARREHATAEVAGYGKYLDVTRPEHARAAHLHYDRCGSGR